MKLDDIVKTYFYKMVKEKSGITKLRYKILPFFKPKYLKNRILLSLDDIEIFIYVNKYDIEIFC